MLRIRLEVTDLAAVRFSCSPLLETVFSLKSWLVGRSRHDAMLRAWFEQTAQRTDRLDWALLRVLRGPRGWIPDFITPRPGRTQPDVLAELEDVRRTAPDVVVRDLAASHGTRLPEPLAALVEDPERLAGRLADALAGYWAAVVAPRWPRIASALQADITHRSHRIAVGGAELLFADLAEQITWSDGVIAVDTPALDADIDVSGRGLPLVPRLFGSGVTAYIDVGLPPALTYPARGRAALLSAQPDVGSPAAALLGRTRARLLHALDEPASTTQLARAFQLTPGAVSQHLAVLHENGLLTRARSGRQVLYRQSPLAAELLRRPGTS